MRIGKEQHVYTEIEKNLRFFIRQSTKGCKIGTFYQRYQNENSKVNLNKSKRELFFSQIDRDSKNQKTENFSDLLEVFLFSLSGKNEYDREYGSKFADRGINLEIEKQNYIDQKLSERPIPKKLEKLNRVNFFRWFKCWKKRKWNRFFLNKIYEWLTSS